MFRKLLVANRGEIACRVMRTAEKLGIKTVAVYASVDRNSLWVQQADEAYELKSVSPTQCYLEQEQIIQIAQHCGAEAIHPGYGFLSENTQFAKKLQESGIVFVGPSPESMSLMASKQDSKVHIESIQVPTVPGFNVDESANEKELLGLAETAGYPLLIKASAGGGGKGMRVVENANEFLEQLAGARREAEKSFGDGRLLVEKFLAKPRHVEVQVFGDNHGNVVHLFERDCSLQRRHQKIVEEAPALGLSEELLSEMRDAAVRIAQSINYSGAGTIEYLVEDGAFYFMEMNTRLQVEHPVTEAITGLDLVEWQLRVSAGEELPLNQEEITQTGHAVEVRLYAENPANSFLPSTGRIQKLGFSGYAFGRIDTGVQSGDEVTMHFDPMIAKVTVHEGNRRAAIESMKHFLDQSFVFGPKTNLGFLACILRNQAYLDFDIYTRFVEDRLDSFLKESLPESLLCVVIAKLIAGTRGINSAWGEKVFSYSGAQKLELFCNGTSYAVEVMSQQGSRFIVRVMSKLFEIDEAYFSGSRFTCMVNRKPVSGFFYEWPDRWDFQYEGQTYSITGDRLDLVHNHTGDDLGHLKAPMPGRVIDVLVKNGQKIKLGDKLVILEAMKMEHVVKATEDTIVEQVFFKPGDFVEEGSELVRMRGQA